MKYSIFSDSEWTFPDSPHNGITHVNVTIPQNGHTGFQILGDDLLSDRLVSVDILWDDKNNLNAHIYELLPVGVNENTAPTIMTTTDFESCKDYVTRQAPFYVYDALKPFKGEFTGNRLALMVDLYAPSNAPSQLHTGSLVISFQTGKDIIIPIACEVFDVLVPKLSETKLGMLNFFDYQNLSHQHAVKSSSKEYWEIFRKYVRAQLNLHCTHIMLPIGKPIYANDTVIDFDFSDTVHAAKIALEEGAPFICGGHIAHWREWTGSEYFLSWDEKMSIATEEGYFQIRLYFSRWASIVEENQWGHLVTQALADEPQDHNTSAYRILAAMFRKFLPKIPIIEAVETTNLGGGVDIWVPKQDTYEKHRAKYDKLKELGETMWFYTCAFPAGPMMNRSMDLPLIISRTVLWMGAQYGLSGFLHWGFNFYIGDDIWNSACCPHKGALLPAGDAHIVYPYKDSLLHSMRFISQRNGAEEYELLMQLSEVDISLLNSIVSTVCTSFSSYTSDSNILLTARKELLASLSKK